MTANLTTAAVHRRREGESHGSHFGHSVLYEELLEAAEELDDVRAYDEAEAEGGEYIPLEQAIKEIEEAPVNEL